MLRWPRLGPLLALAACSDAPVEADDVTTATTTTTSSSGAADDTTATPTDPTPTSGGGEATGSGDTTATTTTGESTASPTSESTAETTTSDPPIDDPRLLALRTYAPRVWLHPGEEYFPSSVEFAFAAMTRFVGGDGNYWIRSIQALDSPSDDSPPFFAGDLEGAPVYAFYADKGGDIVDLVYFFWYPYNRGKSAVDTIWGNHVGDWEHITVRLLRGPDDALAPSQVYLSAHSFGGAYAWTDIERHDITHPVVYSARGSHGVWSAPGDHVYMTIGEELLDVCVTLVCIDLTDETAAGTAWDTWEDVAAFDYVAQEGLGGATWPIWMSEAFTDPGADPPTTPGGGPIFRWGNEEDCTTLGVDISDLIGVCRLEDGPTGPASKGVWGPELQ
jgi:hypothetical protein